MHWAHRCCQAALSSVFCLLLVVAPGIPLNSGVVLSHSSTVGEFPVCWANLFPLQSTFPLENSSDPGIWIPILNGYLLVPAFAGFCDPLPFLPGFPQAGNSFKCSWRGVGDCSRMGHLGQPQAWPWLQAPALSLTYHIPQHRHRLKYNVKTQEQKKLVEYKWNKIRI